MPDLTHMSARRILAILIGWSLLLGLLALCYWAYLRPDFMLELVSGNFIC
ncbi:hypothetical protein ACIPF8_10395 [Collimonas sp. NPDC087041]